MDGIGTLSLKGELSQLLQEQVRMEEKAVLVDMTPAELDEYGERDKHIHKLMTFLFDSESVLKRSA